MDPEGTNVRRVSKSGFYNSSPAWSPSGDRLAWVSRIDGRYQIVVLDLISGTLSRLTRGNWNHENPAWSPDGRHMVFASNREGIYHIYTMRADGGNIRQLTTGVSGETPDWSR
jgi:TolB protein